MGQEKSDKDKILTFLRKGKSKRYCDECISIETGISSSDRVYRICRREWGRGEIVREWSGRCTRCGEEKILNYVSDEEGPNRPPPENFKILEP